VAGKMLIESPPLFDAVTSRMYDDSWGVSALRRKRYSPKCLEEVFWEVRTIGGVAGWIGFGPSLWAVVSFGRVG